MLAWRLGLRLGDSLAVELPALDRAALVRIQVPQPLPKNQAIGLTLPLQATTGPAERMLDSVEGPIDLIAPNDYLMSDYAPDDIIGLSDLDGFLTRIVVGPELIQPSEWLAVIWGREEPEVQTEDEMRTILGTIVGRYNQIVACLHKDSDGFDPIVLQPPGRLKEAVRAMIRSAMAGELHPSFPEEAAIRRGST